MPARSDSPTTRIVVKSPPKGGAAAPGGVFTPSGFVPNTKKVTRAVPSVKQVLGASADEIHASAQKQIEREHAQKLKDLATKSDAQARLQVQAEARSHSYDARGALAPSRPEEPTLRPVDPNAPKYGSTSMRPFFKGQQPDHYLLVSYAGGPPVKVSTPSHGAIPVYKYGEQGPDMPDPVWGGLTPEQHAQQEHITAENSNVGRSVVEGVARLVPGVATARRLSGQSADSAGKVLETEAINTLGLLAPTHILAPIKIGTAAFKVIRDGGDLVSVARDAMAVAKEQRLARATTPIIQRDLVSSPERAQFIDAVQRSNIPVEAQTALVQVTDHNALTLAEQTGEKPSVAWGKANFIKTTTHDVSPTVEEAGAIAQGGHMQRADLVNPPREGWDNPEIISKAVREPEAVPFFSKLHLLVDAMPQKVGVQELLGKVKSAGIKSDEIKWNKFDEFLNGLADQGQKSVTRSEALAWLQKNYLKIEENRRGDALPEMEGNRQHPESNEPLFKSYTLEGADTQNYHEITIRLPADAYGTLYQYMGHFPDANILAHIRASDHIVGEDRTLMIEEIQSDWHQAGQKQGYKTPVEEHPQYAERKTALEEAKKDVTAIESTFRRRAADALLATPFKDLPEHVHQSFELASLENVLGVNLRDGASIRRFVDDARTVKNLLARFPDSRLEVVPGYAPQYHVEVRNYDPEQATSETWKQERYPDFSSANLKKIQYEYLLALRPADFESVMTTASALEHALTAVEEKDYAFRSLARAVSGVEQGPFAKTWHELAFKRVLADAVDKGYARVAWTTGRTQAERYGLANYFRRIEIEEGSGGESLHEWAREMAQSAVDSREYENNLGVNSEYIREQVAEDVPYPSSEDYTDADGNFDEAAYDEAVEEYDSEVDTRTEEAINNELEQRREAILESEINYFMENSYEYGFNEGDYVVRAQDHNGNWHEEFASADSYEDNYLPNVVGPDVAQKYLEGGQTVFEGEDFAVGERAKSAIGASHFYDNKLTGFVNKYLKKTGVQSEKVELGGKPHLLQLRVHPVAPKGWLLEGHGVHRTFADYFEAINEQHRLYGDIPKAELIEASMYDMYGPGHYAVADPAKKETWVKWSDFPEGLERDPTYDGTANAADQRGPYMKHFGRHVWGPFDSPEDAAKQVEETLTNQSRQRWTRTSRAAGTVVHSIPITDEVRAFVDQGQALFQRDPLVQSIVKAQNKVKGAVVLGGKRGSLLHLFQGADTSTVIHELGHVVQQYMPELHGLEAEKFARTFEQYFLEGRAPSKSLEGPMRTIASEMARVYRSASRVPGASTDPEILRMFDSFFRRESAADPSFAAREGAAWFTQDEQSDPMLEAAAMQVTQGGMQVEDAAKMFGLDPEALRAHIEGGGHDAEQARILSNADVGGGAAETTEDAKTILDRLEKKLDDKDTFLFQEEQPFDDESLANVHEPVSDLPADEQLRRGLRSARSRYGIQRVARSEERSRRSREVEKALRTIEDPDHAMAAAKAAMRGELPKIDFQGLKVLDGPALRELKSYVNTHESLLPFQKIRLNDALDRAVLEGRIPTPSELRLIEHVFGKTTAVGIVQHAHSWGDVVINVLNIPRSLMATADLSAVARQGLVAGTSHPVIWGRTFPTMIRSMRSAAFYEKAMEDIKNDPLYNLALAARVSFTDVGEDAALLAHEEQYASDYAARIPGIGHVVKGSARAYTGFLNKIRMDLFKNQIRIALAAGRDVQEEKFLKSVGDVVNAATGRGTIHGRAEHILPALNTMLFSPRLMLSRINYLDPTWYVRLDPQARREALRGLFATAGAVSATLFLFSRIPGVDVGSLDPRSSDFGKLKMGNTRIEVSGGFQQYVRLAAELATNKKVSSTTGEKQKLGSGFGVPTRLDEIQKFVYNKLAPAGSIGVNILRGKDAVGNPTTPTSIATSNFTPLILQDAYDIYKDRGGGMNGIAYALGGYGLAAFGLGEQTYKEKDPAQKPIDKFKKQVEEAGLPPAPQEVLISLDHKAHLDAISDRHPRDVMGRMSDGLEYYAKITGDHSYDEIGKRIKDADDEKSAEQLYKNIRQWMIGKGVGQYESAIKKAGVK